MIFPWLFYHPTFIRRTTINIPVRNSPFFLTKLNTEPFNFVRLLTTGDSFIFADGGKFSASDPQAAPLLTVQVQQPIGIRFEGKPGTISYQGGRDLKGIEVPQKKTLGLIGGEINISGCASDKCGIGN